MKQICTKLFFLSFALLCFQSSVHAQFDVNGQLIERAEYRSGYGKLISTTSKPSVFIGQRLRLQVGYKMKKLQFYASIQDVRTWGSTSQTNSIDGLLSLHEGWAELSIDSFWSVKAGRQELNYDNARFLGAGDWLLQARSHDFALLKFEKGKSKLHIGGGYNQNAEALTGNIYTVSNNYKTAQLLWYNYTQKAFEASAFFWNNGKQYVKMDSLGKVVDHDLRFSQTIGISNLKYSFWKNGLISAFAYYQFGKDIANKNLKAYDASIQLSQVIPFNKEKKSGLKITIGGELLSGTNSNNTSNVNKSFNPMYGTNHAHNGYMDYFYVGGRFENYVGLNDIYLRMKYDINKKWFVSGDLHDFMTNAKVFKGSEALNKQLGLEIDMTAGVLISDDVSFQIGYSQMLPSYPLKYVQSNTAAINQNWAYLMLLIRPKNPKRFIGILS